MRSSFKGSELCGKFIVFKGDLLIRVNSGQVEKSVQNTENTVRSLPKCHNRYANAEDQVQLDPWRTGVETMNSWTVGDQHAQRQRRTRISFGEHKFSSDYIFTRLGTCRACCPVRLRYKAWAWQFLRYKSLCTPSGTHLCSESQKRSRNRKR